LALLFAAVFLGGCATTHRQSDDGADASASRACSVDATDPSLPGVSLHVEADTCAFEVGEGGRFRYRVTLSDPIDYTAAPGGGCGVCYAYSSSPTSLVTYVIGADAVRYCRCDEGCCPNDGGSFTLEAGPSEGAIDWPGKQWNGPSDTNNPLGAPFPEGDYTAAVTFAVPGGGSVTAELPIVVR
jgi:hypothetical protein